MELRDLYPVVLMMIMTGMLLAVGLITLENFGDQVKTTSALVVNESIAYVTTGTAKTTYDEPVAVSYWGNSTVNCQTVATCLVDVAVDDAGYVTAVAKYGNGTYQLSYTYSVDSASTDTADAVVSSMSPIATTWMALIITIIVLSIILGLVINSFAGRRA